MIVKLYFIELASNTMSAYVKNAFLRPAPWSHVSLAKRLLFGSHDDTHNNANNNKQSY